MLQLQAFILHFTDVEFTKEEGKSCDSHYYASFQNLQLAEDFCRHDSACKGIRDHGCNNEGPFQTCLVGYDYNDDPSYCVYAKKIS